MADKQFKPIAVAKSPHSLNGTEIGGDAGVVDVSGTFDLYADVNYGYKISPNLSLTARVTTLYLDPSASAFHPDADRNPLLISGERPPAFAALNRGQSSFKFSATGPHAEDFKRQAMIEDAIKRETIDEALIDEGWDLAKLKDNWWDFLRVVAQAQLLAAGESLEKITDEDAIYKQAHAIINEFSRLNPGKSDVNNATTLRDAMPCVVFVSRLLKETQTGALKTTNEALGKRLDGKEEEDEEALYKARSAEFTAGLIDGASHQGQTEPMFRYRDPYLGEPIPNGAASYGVGAMLKGGYAFDFDTNRKILELNARAAVQQSGRLYFYREDRGKNYDPKNYVINAEAAIVFSPWKIVSLTIKGGVSQGFDELKTASAMWWGAQLAVNAIAEKNRSLTFAPGIIDGVDGEFEKRAFGLDVLWDIRKKYDNNNVSLNFYAARVDREVREIKQEIKQVEDTDGDTASAELGPAWLGNPASEGEIKAPNPISATLEEEGLIVGGEVMWQDPVNLCDPFFIKGNVAVLNGGLKVFSSPTAESEIEMTVNAGVRF